MLRAPAAWVTASAAAFLTCGAHAVPQHARGTVPFVGCPEMEQGSHVSPPQSKTATVDADDSTAAQIAFYGSHSALGVAAPRGWHCIAFSGSSGATLLIAPTLVDTSLEHPPLTGSGIETVELDGGTSGRFGVATYASRLFPGIAASFVRRVKAEGLVPASQFDQGPFRTESVTYSSSLVAHVSTPTGARGFGTQGGLGPGEPISSIVVLDTTGDWELYIVRMRLSGTSATLGPVLLRIDEPCGSDKKCAGDPGNGTIH